MAENDSRNAGIRPAGYAALIERLGLHVIPNWHESSVATGGGTHRIHAAGDIVREIYTPRYWPVDGLGDHLEFALKYDGANLAILASVFRQAPAAAPDNVLGQATGAPGTQGHPRPGRTGRLGRGIFKAVYLNCRLQDQWGAHK